MKAQTQVTADDQDASHANIDRKSIDWFPHREVEAFLFDEAALLDEWKLDDWLSLFTEDAQYVVPTTDLPDGDPATDLVFIDDNWIRLQGRVTRLKSGQAHREHPFSRTRRFISNIRVKSATETEATVLASFIIYRFKGDAKEPFVGHYNYRLARIGAGLKIRYRRATLDMETLRGQGAVSIIV